MAVSSLLAALMAWISTSQQIVNLPSGFVKLGTGQLFGITYPGYILAAALLWYVLERTPLGRRVYATGGNLRGAALAGVRPRGSFCSR